MNQFQAKYRALPRALRMLLTINVVLYLLWVFFFAHVDVTARFVIRHLALNPAFPGILLEPWQLVTYNFLHLGRGFGGFIHILFNMLWLYWVGREYEDLHGPYPVMGVYFLAGIGGGLLTVVLHNLSLGLGAPGMAAFFGGPVSGASASVLGLMMTVAILYPYKKIALIFLGPIRLLYLVIAFLVLDLLFIAGSNTAVGAHLGGVLFGFLFAKGEQSGVDLSSWTRIFFRDRRERRTASPSAPERPGSMLGRLESWLASRSKHRGEPDQPEPTQDKKTSKRRPLRSTVAATEAPAETSSFDNEVDRILDKISEEGYDALTEEEKRILYEASRR